MDHDHHLSYPIRKKTQLEAQAKELNSCHKSFNIILVLTDYRQISLSLLLQNQVERHFFFTSNKNILIPFAEETYPNMHKVQKLKEKLSVKHPGLWSFLP